MENFLKRILVEQGFNPEFLFNRIYTVRGVRYFISVMDKSRHSCFFQMGEKNGSWKIMDVPKVPDWIMNAEKQLGDAIFENRARWPRQ